MFTWYLSNQQIPIISYLFQQLIYSWFFSGKSDSDLGTLFPDRTLINWRNVTGDPHSSFRANGDFLHVIFLSQCYHSCMTVLGFAEKSSAPEHYPLPHSSTMAKPEGTMNCFIIHVFSLRIPRWWLNLHLNAQPFKKRQKQVMMYTTITVQFWQIAFYFLIFLTLLKKGLENELCSNTSTSCFLVRPMAHIAPSMH